MTGAELISGTRLLLRAGAAGRATSNTFYSPDDLIFALQSAREQIVGALLTMRDSIFDRDNGKQRWLAQGLVRIATNRLLKFTASASSGAAVPADFWRLEVGISISGRFIPPESILLGEGFSSQPVDQIYVAGGLFRGTAAYAYYWASPSDAIADTGTAFTEFSDGFYNAVKILAARNILQKEREDNINRWKFLNDLFLRRIATLR